jgi:hypothetical protein
MSYNSTSEIIIKATIDASDATSGADQVVGDLGKIKESAEGAGEGAEKGAKGFKKMVEEAGTMQESRRLMAGLFDTMEGGGRSIEGATDLMRFFLLTVTDLNPVMLGATIILGSIAAALVRHSQAADGAKKSTDDLKEAWKEATAELDSDLKEIEDGKFWDGQLAAAKQVTAEITAQATAVGVLHTAEDKLAAAKKEQALADLSLREQKALQGKTGDEAEDIKRGYGYERSEIEANSQQQRDALELQRAKDNLAMQKRLAEAKQRETDATVDSSLRTFADAKGAKLSVAELPSDYEAARDRQEDYQYRIKNVGAEGIAPLNPAEKIDYMNLGQGGLVEQLRQKQVDAGRPLFTDQSATAKKEIDQLESAMDYVLNKGDTISGQTPEQTQATLQNWETKIFGLREFLKRVATYENAQQQALEASKAMGKALQDNTDAQAKFQSTEKADAVTVQAAQVTSGADNTKHAATQKQQDNEVFSIITTRKNAARDNELDAKITSLQSRLDVAQDDGTKKALNDLLASAQAEKVRNKEYDTLAGTDDPELAKSIKDKAGADAGKLGASAQEKDTKIDARADAAAKRTQDKQDEETIRALHSQIENLGNKQLLEDTKRILQGVLDKHQEIAIMQAELASASSQGFTIVGAQMGQTRQEISKLRDAVSHLQHRTKNGNTSSP